MNLSLGEIKPDTINLIKTEKGRFEIQYENFIIPGKYSIIFTASDDLGNISSPKVCKVNVKKKTRKKAVIIVGKNEPLFDNFYMEEIVPIVFEGLITQGFSEDNILLFGPPSLMVYINNK